LPPRSGRNCCAIHADRATASAASRVAMIGNYLLANVASRPSRQTSATRSTRNTGLPSFWHCRSTIRRRLQLPARVRFELSQDSLASYRQAADFLNFSNIDLVCLQHEYGIFGGPAGSHILELLRRLHMPVVTTLHTFCASQSRATHGDGGDCGLSDRLIVMSRQSSDILQEVFQVSPRRSISFHTASRMSTLPIPIL